MRAGNNLRFVAEGCLIAKKCGVFEKLTACWDKIYENAEKSDRDIIEHYCEKGENVTFVSQNLYKDDSSVRRSIKKIFTEFILEAGKTGEGREVKKLISLGKRVYKAN